MGVSVFSKQYPGDLATPELYGYTAYPPSLRTIVRVEGNTLFFDRYLQNTYKVEFGGAVANAFPLVAGYDVEDAAVEGLTVDGNGKGTQSLEDLMGAIYFLNSRKFTVRNCVARNFAGDGILIFFNDPLPVAQPGKRAVAMALAMQACFAPLQERWQKIGYDLALGIGIAQGYATLGAFGFEGRWDYSAIGSVVNLASRLSDEAQSGQVLIDRRTRAALGDSAEVVPVGPLALKGFSQPVHAFLLNRLVA